MDAFINQLNLIVNFLFDIIMSIYALIMSHYILMLGIAVWVVYRVAKLFKRI